VKNTVEEIENNPEDPDSVEKFTELFWREFSRANDDAKAVGVVENADPLQHVRGLINFRFQIYFLMQRIRCGHTAENIHVIQ